MSHQNSLLWVFKIDDSRPVENGLFSLKKRLKIHHVIEFFF